MQRFWNHISNLQFAFLQKSSLCKKRSRLSWLEELEEGWALLEEALLLVAALVAVLVVTAVASKAEAVVAMEAQQDSSLEAASRISTTKPTTTGQWAQSRRLQIRLFIN